MQEITLGIHSLKNAAEYLDTMLTAKGHSGDLVNKAISEVTSKLKRIGPKKDNETFLTYGQIFLGSATLLSVIALAQGLSTASPDGGSMLQAIEGYKSIVTNWVSETRADEVMQTRAAITPLLPLVLGAMTGGVTWMKSQVRQAEVNSNG